MTLTLVTIPCLADNYAFLIHDPASGDTALVDAPEAAPIAAALDARGWRLSHILLTHHHDDHIAGVPELRARGDVTVIGAAADAHRLPPLDRAVAPGESFDLFGARVDVSDASGHTVGHIAFHVPDLGAVFTGDSLMAMGCGRLFEGSPEQMWATLSHLASLPPQTLVCSGHEYTAANCRFAESVDPANPARIARTAAVTAARAAGKPTVPSVLADEIAANPFLRAANAAFRAEIGMADRTPAQVFAHLRALKDRF